VENENHFFTQQYRPFPGLQYFFFQNNDIQKNWRCVGIVGKGETSFQEGNLFSIYQMPALIRVLALKNKLITEKLANDLYKTQKNQLCKIVSWQSMDHKVVIAQWNNQSTSDDMEQVIAFLSQQNILENIFVSLRPEIK
jgi:hypothetical protein